jgi:predicted ribosomally synthesized peptide with nif11-like leader
MSTEAVAELVDRWTNEPAFREQMREDPEGAVRASGVQLDQEEWAALQSVDWKLSDQELEGRASRMMCA